MSLLVIFRLVEGDVLCGDVPRIKKMADTSDVAIRYDDFQSPWSDDEIVRPVRHFIYYGREH